MATEKAVGVLAVPESASLFFQSGSSDKVYNLKLEQCETGWSVFASWGRRGSTQQSEYKCERQAFEDAKRIYDATLKSKLAKGYQFAAESKPVGSEKVNRAPISKEVIFSAELLTRIDSERELLAYMKSPRYFLQIKRDGRRLTIVATSPENIFGYNKLGQVVQLDFGLRKAVETLMALTQNSSLILDGEWESSGFWAWDLLHLKYDCRGARYEDRLDLLQELLNHPRVAALKMFNLVATARTESLKLDLYKQAKRTRAEGLCLKNKDAQYRGGRNGQHMKFKFECAGSFIVGPKPPQKAKDGHRSVALYCFDKGRKRYMGTVKIADKYNVPAEGAVVEVRYLYVLAGFDAKLYQPCFFGVVRDDVRPEDCTAQQLKLKQSDEDAAA